MEETKKARQVEMKPIKKDNPDKKLSYEELNNTCVQLYQQNQHLLKQMSQMNMTNMFKRLDYLFMVLKYESVIKDAEFVNACVEEIKTAIAGEPEENETKEEQS
jgi:hypothetical protein